MLVPGIKNEYPTFANPAGIGSCRGYEPPQPLQPSPQEVPTALWGPEVDPAADPALLGNQSAPSPEGPWGF